MLFYVVAFLIIITFSILAIKNTLDAKKIMYSRIVYMDIKELSYSFETRFKDVKGEYPILSERVKDLEELIKGNYSFPYEKLKLTTKISLSGLLEDIEEILKMLDEREKATKNGLPDLYHEISKINNLITKIYFPFKTKIKKTYYGIMLCYIVVRVKGEEILKRIFNSKDDHNMQNRMKNMNSDDIGFTADLSM